MYTNKVGGIGWVDLTVKNAGTIRDFYSEVIGWDPKPKSMGDYDDYVMQHPDDETLAVGICHKLGPNKDIPNQWLPYFVVRDLDAALDQVNHLGGDILLKNEEEKFAIIKDPAGAFSGLWESR